MSFHFDCFFFVCLCFLRENALRLRKFGHFYMIDSWRCPFPMMKVRHGRDAKRRVYDELGIGRVHSYFYHATEQCTKICLPFFSRIHPTSPFRMKCRGHWTDYNHFQGSITRFDYGHFQMKTCSYGAWAFNCKIGVLRHEEDTSMISIFGVLKLDKSSQCAGPEPCISTSHPQCVFGVQYGIVWGLPSQLRKCGFHSSMFDRIYFQQVWYD